MKVKRATLSAIKSHIAAKEGDSPYLTGNEIVELFKEIGIDKDLDKSRGNYVLERLNEINGTQKLVILIEEFILYSMHKLEKDNEIVDFLKCLNRTLSVEGYEIKKENGKYIVSGGNIIGGGTTEVYFSAIQNKIIEKIREAEYTIWIAVAWFTDKKILNELIKKSNEGVNVRLIVNDDKTNAGFQFEDHFETIRLAPRGQHKNIMHNKFCIIDNRIVINGAYNWSKRAKYNNENIEIKENNPGLAQQFAKEFKNLVKER
ncbi:Archaeal transcriptional regulator TrmB [Paraliobacillus sp. PM-2]|uniref:phospholipase D-like domain-containing protein n=1 Tax=Paraliobacillus sp. PM-2 TaxID=1462524 RepID=UPI00061C9202|nr:phospholipase D-like domain-containing protein [Paraliobacillus sp. PM-2]CQR46594.1 Archaeal transcriptional regulator TrmB [Paraliobacillus sp. PM-2]